MKGQKIRYAWNSIRRTIPVVIVFPMVLGIILTGYITYRNIQLAENDLSTQLRIEISSGVDRQIEQFFLIPQKLLQTCALEVSRKIPLENEESSTDIPLYFISQLSPYPFIEAIEYRSVEGKVQRIDRLLRKTYGSENEEIWLTFIDPLQKVFLRKRFEAFESIEESTAGKGDANKPLDQEGVWDEFSLSGNHDIVPEWYSKALQNSDDAAWTIDLKEKRDPTRDIILSRVVRHSGITVGVVSFRISFNAINNLLRKIESESGVTSYLLLGGDTIGISNVLATSGLISEDGANKEELNSGKKKTSVLENSLDRLRQLGLEIEKLDRGETQVFGSRIEEESFDAEIRPVLFGLEKIMYSVIVIPRSDFTSKVRSNTRSTGLLILAGLLVTTWLGMRMARRIVDPVLGLSRAASTMRNPDFDATEILHIGKRSDEFGELARSFSEMAEVVAIREKQLEGMVEKRTEQVREQAREIELKNNQNEQLLLNILPLPIAHRLQKGERDIADFYSSASVLFSDLVGFTALSSEMSSNALLVMLNEIFTEFDHLCLGFGVEKIKTLGDGYMAAAGLPVPREDHASVLIALALGMQESLSKFNEKHNSSLQLRIGINSGPVTAGVIGTHKFIYDLWGDAVNIASRMESTGESDRIQVSESTYKLVKDTYQLKLRGEIDVKGKGKMKTWWVSGVQKGANLPMRARELQDRDFDVVSITQPDTGLDTSSSWIDILGSDVSMTSIRALLGKDLFGKRGNQQNTEGSEVKSAAENITWEELLKSEVNSDTLRMLLKKDLFGRKKAPRSPSEIVSATEEILENLAVEPIAELPPKDKDIS